MKPDDVKSTGLDFETRPSFKKQPAMINIPTNSFVVFDKTIDSKYCHVRQVKEATIQLTGFAIAQFLEGAELVIADTTITMMKIDNVKLILRLSKSIPMLQAEQMVKIDVTRDDLQTLRKWLELRMAHCERERNERIVYPGTTQQKFNPDTYIGQKLLLLDLRELLLGEIIEG